MRIAGPEFGHPPVARPARGRWRRRARGWRRGRRRRRRWCRRRRRRPPSRFALFVASCAPGRPRWWWRRPARTIGGRTGSRRRRPRGHGRELQRARLADDGGVHHGGIGPLSQMAIVGRVNRTSRAKSSPLKMGPSSSSWSSSFSSRAIGAAASGSTEPFRTTTPSSSSSRFRSTGGGSRSSMLARSPAVESTAARRVRRRAEDVERTEGGPMGDAFAFASGRQTRGVHGAARRRASRRRRRAHRRRSNAAARYRRRHRREGHRTSSTARRESSGRVDRGAGIDNEHVAPFGPRRMPRRQDRNAL